MPRPVAPSIPLLEVSHLAKRFHGVPALDDVRFDLWPGEIHCLLGENGAGKSTLLRICAGLVAPDDGELRIRGERCSFASPRDAIARGVAMIHQELLPFPDLTVAENIFMGREPAGRLRGTIDRRRMQSGARELLGQLGCELPVDALMRQLTVSQTQMVEIAKAMARHASILIMDEPTSSLSHHEAEALFRLIGDLRRQGVGFVYVSHKMDEIFRLGDRATILRDGRYIATQPLSQLDEATVVSLMVGRPLRATPRAAAPPGEPLLSVEGLARAGWYEDIGFTVRRGEVLGLGGLMGAGRTEVVSAIYGLAPADRGTIAIRGQRVHITHPRDALHHRIGFVSEDRKQVGLVLGASIQHNVSLAALDRCCHAGVIQHRRELTVAEDAIRRFRIRAAGPGQLVRDLSGGNQQKVVLAKVLFADPEVLILDEPTRGIDIGAKQEIYAMIAEWAQAGRAIILVSSELPELLALSDRILVLRAGRIRAELTRDQFSQEEILRHAMPD